MPFLPDLAVGVLEPEGGEPPRVDHPEVLIDAGIHHPQPDRHSPVQGHPQVRLQAADEVPADTDQSASARLPRPAESVLEQTVIGRVVDVALLRGPGRIAVLRVVDAPHPGVRGTVAGRELVGRRWVRVVGAPGDPLAQHRRLGQRKPRRAPSQVALEALGERAVPELAELRQIGRLVPTLEHGRPAGARGQDHGRLVGRTAHRGLVAEAVEAREVRPRNVAERPVRAQVEARRVRVALQRSEARRRDQRHRGAGAARRATVVGVVVEHSGHLDGERLAERDSVRVVVGHQGLRPGHRREGHEHCRQGRKPNAASHHALPADVSAPARRHCRTSALNSRPSLVPATSLPLTSETIASTPPVSPAPGSLTTVTRKPPCVTGPTP